MHYKSINIIVKPKAQVLNPILDSGVFNTPIYCKSELLFAELFHSLLSLDNELNVAQLKRLFLFLYDQSENRSDFQCFFPEWGQVCNNFVKYFGKFQTNRLKEGFKKKPKVKPSLIQ